MTHSCLNHSYLSCVLNIQLTYMHVHKMCIRTYAYTHMHVKVYTKYMRIREGDKERRSLGKREKDMRRRGSGGGGIRQTENAGERAQ